jgi:putative peptidoglycan lipid II flippase
VTEGDGLTTPPAGPGWNGDQEPDWYTGPLYDDTGWHIDLSEAQRELADSDHGDREQPTGAHDPPFPHQPSYEGNGGYPGEPGRDWQGADRGQSGPADRTAGRHARHARQEENYPPSSSPLARYSHPDPDYAPYQESRGRADGYPDPSGYPDSASPLARFSRPDQAGQDYRGYSGQRDQAEQHPYQRQPDYGDYQEPRGYQEPPGRPAPGPDPYAAPPPGNGAPDRNGRYDTPDRYEVPEEYDQDLSFLRERRSENLNPTLALSMTGPIPPETGPIEVVRVERRGPPKETGTESVVRSSGVMAIGTLGSRLTGFLRTIAQSWALGVAGLATAYNLSNTLPNVVYNLALGGILTSVIVPLIVNAKKRDPSSGSAYEQRMFTLLTALLLGVTVLGTILAVPIVHLYSGRQVTGATEHLAIIFALFFIPQIFFYGFSALIGAVLNTRGSFAAPMWTPIINNIVVIGVLGLYVVVAGTSKTPGTISEGQIWLLGLGTTLGIVAQTAALFPALRRVGFRWQPRSDFRRAEVSEIGRMAGWMFCYIIATQVAFLVTTKIAGNTPHGSGVTYYQYAWLLFQLPYAVVGVSVITALLPRMSAHASERRLGLVRADFATGIRLSSVIVVPCSLVLAVLGPAIAILFLGHGSTGAAQARTIGIVFACFCVGLLPFTIFQLQLRVFYSLHDSKTPGLIGLVTMTVNIIANLIADSYLSQHNLVAGLAVGFGVANFLGCVIAWRILSRRMRGLKGRVVGGTIGRLYAATVPAALLALFVSLLVDNVVSGPRFASMITIVLGGGGALLVFILFAQALRITEVTDVGRTLRSRLSR